MLDDLKLIHERDVQDALGIAEKQYAQLEIDYNLAKIEGNFKNVVVAGMGGSALAAAFVGSWPSINLPFEICKNYDIPTYVNEDTLFIASSYSGNTEETIAALSEAKEKGAKIAIITSGGSLKQIALDKGYPATVLPSGFQPRMAVLANWAALLQILDAASITNNASLELRAKQQYMHEISKSWLPTVATKDNLAKQIAQDVAGKNIVIYSGPKLFPSAYKWKISFNENAKNIAWCNQYPEFNHNEFLGWTSHPLEKLYAVIDLRSNLENPRVQKRFAISERLLSGRRPSPIVVEVEGVDILEQLLWSVALGDFVSLYTAILNGLNPSPVELIEKLKIELAK